VPKPKFASVDDYVAAQRYDARSVLECVRTAVRKAVPGVEEAISYGFPAFKLDGRVLLHLAAWKRHYSLYPANERVVAAFGEELDPYLAERSTLRFAFSQAVPAELIGRIAKFRAKEASR
jgi:uncharacterized protein YdhG (YjbR/CyaY superfamily)